MSRGVGQLLLGVVILVMGLSFMRTGRRVDRRTVPPHIAKKYANAGVVITVVGAIIMIGAFYLLAVRR